MCGGGGESGGDGGELRKPLGSPKRDYGISNQTRPYRSRGPASLVHKVVRLLLRPRLRRREDALPHLDAQPADTALLVACDHQALLVDLPSPSIPSSLSTLPTP